VIANVLRLLVLLEASLVLWLTAIVLRRYGKRYLTAARSGIAGRRKAGRGRRGDTDWIGLLPKHVSFVTAFSLMAVVQAIAVCSSRLGDSLLWYGTPWSLIELALLLAGLLTIAGYENRLSGRR
jgi:hypothetical protein